MSASKSRAVLWESGAIFDLNNLIQSGSPLYLQYVETINDRGEIAGQGADSSGNEHAFLLIPCDKNHPGVEGCDYTLADASTATQPGTPASRSSSLWGANHGACRSPPKHVQQRSELQGRFVLFPF
jgi:hypothetical protein